MKKPKKPPRRDEKGTIEYYEGEKSKFSGLLKHVHRIGNAIGSKEADELRVISSWLYVRICVSGHTIEQLLDPPLAPYGDNIRYLDHASIAILCRGIIENVAVLLHIGDHNISSDEWECRRTLVDIHDMHNRHSFLTKFITNETQEFPQKNYDEICEKLNNNAFFQMLPIKRQRKLLDGDDMFVNGRHEAMLELGWGEDATRAVYKYLSNQAHTLSMAFHRTAINEIYKKESAYARYVSGLALGFARLALGSAILRMIDLFPDIELSLDGVIVSALRSQYGIEPADALPTTR